MTVMVAPVSLSRSRPPRPRSVTTVGHVDTGASLVPCRPDGEVSRDPLTESHAGGLLHPIGASTGTTRVTEPVTGRSGWRAPGWAVAPRTGEPPRPGGSAGSRGPHNRRRERLTPDDGR